MLYIDFLKNRFSSQHDNDPKTNGWHVKESEFHFYVMNDESEGGMATIDYKHRFHLLKHDGKLDILILHTAGDLVRKTQETDVDVGVNYFYQKKVHSIVPRPCISDVNHARNQELDRACSTLRKINTITKEEWLEFHYRTEREYNLEEDEVLVIYPSNYGKKFSGVASFYVHYAKSYVADIQLYQLPYGSTITGQMKSIAHLERNGECTSYSCHIKSIKPHNVYFIIIKKKPLI